MHTHTHFNSKIVWYRISTSQIKSFTNSPKSPAEVPQSPTGTGAQAVANSLAFLTPYESTCLFCDPYEPTGECVHQMHLLIHKWQ